MLALLKRFDLIRFLRKEFNHPQPTLTSLMTPMGHYVRRATRNDH